MKNKKAGDLTFQEYLEMQKDKEAARSFKQLTYELLKREGFMEEQINNMKMQRVWKLFLDASRIKDMTKILKKWNRELEEKLKEKEKREG